MANNPNQQNQQNRPADLKGTPSPGATRGGEAPGGVGQGHDGTDHGTTGATSDATNAGASQAPGPSAGPGPNNGPKGDERQPQNPLQPARRSDGPSTQESGRGPQTARQTTAGTGDGLRTDGPTLEEYQAAGFGARDYPPTGYAVRDSPGWKTWSTANPGVVRAQAPKPQAVVSGRVGGPFNVDGSGFGNGGRLSVGGREIPTTVWTDTKIKGTLEGMVGVRGRVVVHAADKDIPAGTLA